MNIFFSSFLLVVIIFVSGCEDERQIQQNEFRSEIEKQKSYVHEQFPTTNDKIDDRFDKKQIYVPIYSHIFISEDKYVKLFVTLSIRNTDLTKNLYVESIDYYNSEGKFVKHYISQPHILKPMGSVEYYVSTDDMSGGIGANFIVNVASDNNTTLPIIQAVMISGQSSDMTFVTQGQVIK